MPGRRRATSTARAAEIVVRAGADGDRIVLTVADRGPGIPEGDRARVVERFVRLEQSRSQPGSGLGLSLASAVARLHGGELKLEDNHPGLRASSRCRAPGRRGRDDEARGRQAPPKQTAVSAKRHWSARCRRRLAARHRAPTAVRALPNGLPSSRERPPASALESLLDGASAAARAARRLAERGALSVGPRPRRSGAAAAPAQRRPRRRTSPRSSPATARPPRRRARDAEAMRLLRRMKAEAALLIALADIGGVWAVMRVTAALTDVADTALGAAVAPSARRGRTRRQASRCRIRERSGGRLAATSCWPWARWAPTSSTIPATSTSWCFSIRAAPALAPDVEPAPFFVRLTRDLVKLLQERTARRLCVSRRSAAAPRSVLDPDRDLDRGGARLLREPRPELGARRADQGARRAPATSRPARRCCASWRPSSGANISTSPRLPTCTR